MGVRSTNKANYGPRWESLNTYFHNGHMGEFYNTQMRAGKGTEPGTGAITTTGGTKYIYSGKTIHRFNANDNFIISGASPTFVCEVVVVGGGGGGGAYRGGGGGSGGVAICPAMPFGPGTHAVVVGALGAKGTAPGSATDVDGTPGGDSTITNGSHIVTAKGGGNGGGGNHTGAPGGSGGGSTWPTGSTGSTTQPTQNPSYPFTVTNSGNAGGGASPGPPKYGSGGGGGAGGAGHAGITNGGGDGGASLQLPPAFRDPTNPVGFPGPGGGAFWVAGGGGGGSIFSNVPKEGFGGGPGGPFGGAGNGGPWTGGPGVAAQANSGSGGGGSVCVGDPYGQQRSGGDGGSGLVLIAYTPT